MSVIQWKDKQGRAWSFRLTIADAKRLKDAGYDIGDLNGFQKLFGHALSCIEIIAEALRPQWEASELTYDQFVDVITEDVDSLGAVKDCFREGLQNFFLRIGEKATATIVERASKAAELSTKAMAARAASPEVASFIQRALEKDERDYRKRLALEEAKLFGETSNSAAESSEPTQAPGPTEN